MPHIAISMYPGRSREEKAALAEKVRTLVSEELKKDPKVVTVSVMMYRLRNGRNIWMRFRARRDSIRSLSRGCRKRQKIIRRWIYIPMDNIAQAVSKK